MCQVYNFLKCHRNVSKQTNCSEVDDLITNKPPGNFEASRRILHAQARTHRWPKVLFLQIQTIFKNIMK